MKKIFLLVCLMSTSVFAQTPHDEAYADYVNSHADEILAERTKAMAAKEVYALQIKELTDSYSNSTPTFHIIDATLIKNGVELCDINPTTIKSGEVIGDAPGETLWCDTGDSKIAISLYCEASTQKIYVYLFNPNQKTSFAQAKTKIVDESYLALKKEQRAAAIAASEAEYMEREMKYHPVSVNF